MMEQGCAKFPVLASLRPVVERCRWVQFDPAAVGPAIEQWGRLLPRESTWKHPCHLDEPTVKTVRWIFVLDVLNHCFWADPGEPVWTVFYKDQAYSGYWGLAAALKRAMEEGFPITDARFLAEISREDMSAIFRGKGEIPMLEERWRNLREAGRVLVDRWKGGIENLIKAAQGCALQSLRLIVGSFASFRDEADYRGHRIIFWKRAQLFLADVSNAFMGKSWGAFANIDCLTGFADYKLPQVLRQLGILRYHPLLVERVDNREFLLPGSQQEVEIRAMTIHAVENIKKAFQRTNVAVTSIQVDQWLWQLGQLQSFRCKPYHLCRTIFY